MQVKKLQVRKLQVIKWLFHFPMKQLIIYTWEEYSEIGIIFRIIMNQKILDLP